MAGKWEFPGGKCGTNETPEACVKRETLEEVGCAVVIERLRSEIFHTYPHGYVRLCFFDCRLQNEHDEPNTDSGFIWTPLETLSKLEFPEGNSKIISQLLQEKHCEPEK